MSVLTVAKTDQRRSGVKDAIHAPGFSTADPVAGSTDNDIPAALIHHFRGMGAASIRLGERSGSTALGDDPERPGQRPTVGR